MTIEKQKKNTLKGNSLREYKQIITLNQIQKKVIVGTRR